VSDQCPDQATIDHLYSKLDGRRAESNDKVLSCYACNHSRAKKETKAMWEVFKLVAPWIYNPDDGTLDWERIRVLDRSERWVVVSSIGATDVLDSSRQDPTLSSDSDLEREVPEVSY